MPKSDAVSVSAGFISDRFPSADRLSWPQEQSKNKLPEGEEEQPVVELCGNCHNLEKIVAARKSEKEWDQSVQSMVNRGAQLFPEEIEQIVKYLAKSFPAARPAS